MGRAADGEELLRKFVDVFRERPGRGEPEFPPPRLFWTAERRELTDIFLCSEAFDTLLSSLREFELGVRRGAGVLCETLGGGGRSWREIECLWTERRGDCVGDSMGAETVLEAVAKSGAWRESWLNELVS